MGIKRMWKQVVIGLLVSVMILIPNSVVANSPEADSHKRDFYSAGITYRALADVNRIEGHIVTVIGRADKPGEAGIEQDIIIQAEEDKYTLEVINWFYGDETKVGYVLYKWGDPNFQKAERVVAQQRVPYHYQVFIGTKGFTLQIKDLTGQTIIYFYQKCDKPKVLETISYIEYWCYNEPGSFLYYGYVTIDDPANLQKRSDFYYKWKGVPFGMYLIHHNWDGNYVDKGEIDDR